MKFFKRIKSSPGEYDREQAAKCRAAAALAKQEGDIEHADMMESSALKYEEAALLAVRADREKRAGATPWSYSW